jgi:hypothetical protein
MEYWKNGIMGFHWFEENGFPQHSNIPLFHHSIEVVL